MMLLPYLLAVSVSINGGRIPSCDAPQLGKPFDFRPRPNAVRDSIALDTRTVVTVADSQAVQDARVDIGLRCAIEVLASWGDLRAYELQATSELCTLSRTGTRVLPSRLQWRDYDAIDLCRLSVTRDSATGELLHATLRVIARGGPVEADGRKLMREYDVRLVRYAGSRRWAVTSYTVRIPE
jgi:hypothetical protein